MQEGAERFRYRNWKFIVKYDEKHNKDFVMGYAFNLCKNQVLIVPCN